MKAALKVISGFALVLIALAGLYVYLMMKV